MRGATIWPFFSSPLWRGGVWRRIHFLVRLILLGNCACTEDCSETPGSCCLEGVAVSLLSCFTTGSDTGCLDAVPLLTKPKENVRCNFMSGCEGSTICVRPTESAQLLRISVQVTGQEDDEIILWRGPKKEVLQQGESSAIESNHCNLLIAILQFNLEH